ncbi:MAG: hypothetical protein ACKO4Z_12700 [Planctomycetota bacterium]
MLLVGVGFQHEVQRRDPHRRHGGPRINAGDRQLGVEGGAHGVHVEPAAPLIDLGNPGCRKIPVENPNQA